MNDRARRLPRTENAPQFQLQDGQRDPTQAERGTAWKRDRNSWKNCLG